MINRLERLANCGKSAAARIIAGVGIRTPRMTRISSIDELRELLEGLEPPLLIREEYGHGERSVLISERREIERVDLSRFRQPIAVEFIDVRDDAGLYRKYRYIALGTSGIVRHMMVNRQWEVRPERRVINDLLRDEELTYLGSPDPNEGLLQCARAALGMDVVGFDYSYDRQGRMVVWEANPFPDFNYPNPELASHIFPVVKRCFAGLVKLYFERAGLPAPNKALDLLAAGFSAGSAARPRAVAA